MLHETGDGVFPAVPLLRLLSLPSPFNDFAKPSINQGVSRITILRDMAAATACSSGMPIPWGNHLDMARCFEVLGEYDLEETTTAPMGSDQPSSSQLLRSAARVNEG